MFKVRGHRGEGMIDRRQLGRHLEGHTSILIEHRFDNKHR